MISLRTDGSCTTAGRYEGVGGWAYVIKSDPAEFENAGGEMSTTNNLMEIEAIIRGLTQIYETHKIFAGRYEFKINVFTDSQLVIKTYSGEYKARENKAKWTQLMTIIEMLNIKGFTVNFSWEKGKTTEDTKYIDKLAKKARDEQKNLFDIDKMKVGGLINENR